MPYGDDDIENELKVRKLLEEHTDWSFEFTKNDRYAVDMQLFDWGEPPVDADARSLVGYVEIEVANEESDWDTGEFPWPRVNFLKRKIRLWDWDKNNWGDLKANARKTIYLKFNNQLDKQVEDEGVEGDIDSRVKELFGLLSRTHGRIDELEETVESQQEHINVLKVELEHLQEVIRDDSRDAKVASLVVAAENIADSTQKGCVMNYKQIKQATGVSNQGAYNYIEELPDEYPFLVDRKDVPDRVDVDSRAKERGLVVLFNEVEHATGSFNRLYNEKSGKGGSK